MPPPPPPPIPPTMPAWRTTFTSPTPFLTTLPTPTPSPSEILVKILAAGVCHSDCTLLAMIAPILGQKPEFTLGHEACGEIVALGSGVRTTSSSASKEGGFEVGDRVALHIIPGCGLPTCSDCARGLGRVCRGPGSGNYGLGISEGFFAGYAVVDARAAVKMPASLRVEEAAVAADAVLTAYHAVRYTGGVGAEHTVAIFGLGGVGMNGLQTALWLGVERGRILVVDKKEEVLDEAVRMGVERQHVFLATAEGPGSIEGFVAERGVQVDVVFDFVGSEETMKAAQMVVRSGGTIVLVGLMSPVVPIVSMVTVLKAVVIKTGYNGTMEAFRECLELMAEGVLEPKVATTGMSRLPEVLKQLDEGSVSNRMVLLPDWD